MSLLRQSLLVIVTAILVTFLPSYLSPRYPVPEIFGTVAPGFEEVVDTFRESFELGWEKPEAGSAYSVYYKGDKVVDIWAGYADQEAKILWKENTMSVMYSTSKGFCALVVAMLADRGLLDFKKPVSHYWPEFAQNGKEKITVEMLMEHEAALPYFPEAMTFDMLRDPTAMDKVIENAKPLWEPGTGHGYHAISLGFLVNGLVRRVDPEKRTVGQFLDDEVAKPFEIDVFIGTPPIESLRVSRTVIVEAYFFDKVYAFATSWLYRQILSAFILQTPAGKMATDMFENCGELCETERQVDSEIRQLEMPAVNGVATARAIAKTFGILANGGKLGNKTLLSEEMIDAYSFDRRGETPDLCLFGLKTRWKYGMHLISQGENEKNLFGSPGGGGQVGYADPNRVIGYGYVTRFMSPEGWALYDPRIRRLQESTLSAITKLETRGK